MTSRTIVHTKGRRSGPNPSRSLGRCAATPREWAILRLAIILRARSRCQACGARARLEVHHIIKRSQGGSDFDLDQLVALCRPCHDLTDAPYRDGRLLVTPRGDGTFECTRIWAASKWDDVAIRRAVATSSAAGSVIMIAGGDAAGSA
jgi:hypothetical protein